MSQDNPHIDPTDGIEDVELEDDELEGKSFDELVKEREATTHEAIESYRSAVSEDGEGQPSDSMEKSNSGESDGPAATVEDPTVEDDGDLIKYTGIAMMDVDTDDPDEEAMRDLIKQKREGEVEIGFENSERDVDPVVDSVQSGPFDRSFESDTPLPEMKPGQQAAELTKEAVTDLNIDSIVEEAADLPKSPGAVRDEVFEKVYSDVTRFVRTIYGEAAIDADVLKTVRNEIATDAANRACVRRKANEDGVTVDSPNYSVSEDGEDAVEEEVESESEDGGETDAPKTDGDSEDVNLDGDVDLEG